LGGVGGGILFRGWGGVGGVGAAGGWLGEQGGGCSHYARL
jgi:hypothetical protein